MSKLRISDNGIIRDMTPAEEAEYNAMLAAQPAPEPTAEERLEALEAAMLELVMGGAE